MIDQPSDAPELPRGRPGWSRFFFVAILLVAVAVALALGFLLRPRRGGEPAGPESPLVANALTRVDLQPLTGEAKPVTLADLAGKVTLINFWGTWCPPCRMEFPRLVPIYDEFRARSDFRFLSVSSGTELTEPEADVNALRQDTLAFLFQVRLDVPTYTDADGRTRQAINAAGGFEGYPTTLVLDRKSIIRGAWAGYEPGLEQEMRDLVVKLLEE
ncbi:MAG: TlpA family protein disulfide reductase [Pirellulales bacterium]